MIEKFEHDFKLFSKSRGVDTLVYDDFCRTQNKYIEPTIIEERHLNATQISVFSRLFMERILFLGSEIDNDVANIMNSQLLFLQMENPEKPITLYINSPGGDVYAGLSIYDVFKYVSCPIETTCLGMAASMGAVLLSSGDKGSRTSLPHSKIMIHQPLGGTGYAQASDIEITNREIQKCKKTLYNILSDNTGKSYEEIESACDRDNYLTSEEAVNFGLIDSIIEHKSKK